MDEKDLDEIPEAEVLEHPDLTDPSVLDKFVTILRDDEFTYGWRAFVEANQPEEFVFVLAAIDWIEGTAGVLREVESKRLPVCAQDMILGIREARLTDSLAVALGRYMGLKQPRDVYRVEALVDLVCQKDLSSVQAMLAWHIIQRGMLSEMTDALWQQIADHGRVEDARHEAQVRLARNAPTMQFRPMPNGVAEPVPWGAGGSEAKESADDIEALTPDDIVSEEPESNAPNLIQELLGKGGPSRR